MEKSAKFSFQCVTCGKVYKADVVKYLCPSCAVSNSIYSAPKGVLKIIYDFRNIQIDNTGNGNINHILSKYLPILPVQSIASFPNLRVGQTPVYELHENGSKLFIKDDTQNPTYSFKDRASSFVSAIAKEQGIDTLVTASTGNAGSSIAGICAAQGQKAVVLVPAKAPIAKLTQILMYGANIVPIEGTYDQAFNLSVAISDEVGLYNRNTAYNPFTIEGKKTVSLEIYEQFKGSIPDYIYVPVGDGVILSGVYKGFEDLIQLGFLNKMPVIVSVQATKSNNIVRNLKTPKPDFQPATSIADSINVTIPRNYYMAVDYINKYHGMTVEVTDDEILKASLELSKRSGLFAEPAAAATFAGFKKFTSHNKNQGQHLIILTGSGLKDLQSVNSVLPKIQSVPDTISAVKKVLNF